MKRLICIFVSILAMALVGCEGSNADGLYDTGQGDADTDTDNDSDSDDDTSEGNDSDTDGNDTSSDTDTNFILGDAKIAGVVKSASGFVISGALVYLANSDGTEIPDEAYCQECDEVIQGQWTTSNADGTWAIDTAPEGTMNIVTRKGNFQRQREITVIDTGSVQQIPEETTTLPGANTSDGLDQIPNYAVLLNGWDKPEDMIAKMGLADLSGAGVMVPGTEQFDVYDDLSTGTSSVGDSSLIFASQDSLNHYHMVFFPCVCSHLTVSADYITKLTAWIAAGGKMYGSCWAGHWPEGPFPDVIDFSGADTGVGPGDIGPYNTKGTIENADMRDWLEVVSSGENLDDYTFEEGWITLDGYSSTAYDGHGLIVNDDYCGPRK